MFTKGLILLLLCSICTAHISVEKSGENANDNEVVAESDILNPASFIDELMTFFSECWNKNCDKGQPTQPIKPSPNPVDCLEVNCLGYTRSGRYNIYPSISGASDVPVPVWCDMDGGGWTVIQRREDGTVDFNRTWANYKAGFGYIGGEFWLGNDNIHNITYQKSYQLRIETTLWNGSQIMADYDHFRMGDEASKYSMFIGSLLGNREEEDCETLDEIHLTGPAEQSSISHDGVPARAIDGNTNGYWSGGSCTHTVFGRSNWWSVDTGEEHCVGKVVIYNRQDCCGERLVGARVHVGVTRNGDNSICGTINRSDVEETSILEITCNVKGRYINVTLPRGDYLTLCEVKAYVGDCGEGQRLQERHLMPNVAYKEFSTKDEDNDEDDANCARSGGAWWYGTCNQAGSNGAYHRGSSAVDRGITWEDGYGQRYQLKRTEMKIRPVS